MNPNLYAIVAADSACVGLIGDGSDIRFYRDSAPQDVAQPYVRWFTVYGDTYNKLDDPPDMDATRVQFDVFALDTVTADAIFDALRSALESHGYLITYFTGRDPDTMSFFVTFEMTFKNSR